VQDGSEVISGNRSYGRITYEDAEEMVTDTLMKFINAEMPAGCAADAWLYTVARNVVIDWVAQADCRQAR
jgi:DNA-directed RNA polymerase specialized sigma24 family protein